VVVQDVNPGNDASTDMAIALARTIANAGNTDWLDYAIVDCDDGLAIFHGEPDAPSFAPHNKRGWHFASALCGYGGEGPGGSATILELFGFGDREDILEQICRGGDYAHFHFRKGEGLVRTTR
jgi:hypothetical protein